MSTNGRTVKATVEGYGTLVLREARQVPQKTAFYKMTFLARLSSGDPAAIEEAISQQEAAVKVVSIERHGLPSSLSITVTLDTRGARSREKYAYEFVTGVIETWASQGREVLEAASQAERKRGYKPTQTLAQRGKLVHR